MLRSYFKIAVRNLWRKKVYTFINVAGLAVGIACCLVLFSVIGYELSFENFHSNRERIYRIVTELGSGENMVTNPGAPLPIKDALQTDFPELEVVTQIIQSGGVIEVEHATAEPQAFREDGAIFYAEPALFSMFDFQWLSADAVSALANPESAILTQEYAEKYFGDWQTAIGENLAYQDDRVYEVKGILENIPQNSDFRPGIIFSREAFGKTDDWGGISSNIQTYFMLPKGMDIAQIERQLPAFIEKYEPANRYTRNHLLQPYTDLHYNATYPGFSYYTINKSSIWTMALVGIFILLLACINFINLATASAVSRSKEVGVRKVLGSSRLQLSGQFLGETFIIVLCALLLSVGLSNLAMPFINPFTALPEGYQLLDTPHLPIAMVAILLLVTLFAGSYPALTMSGFKPIQAIRHKISNQEIGGVSLRKGLVVLQFAVSQVFIIGTIIALQQLSYVRHMDMGFSQEALVRIDLPNLAGEEGLNKQEVLRREFLQNPNIQSVSFSNSTPADFSNWSSNFRFDTRTEDEDFSIDMKYADADFFTNYDIEFIAGSAYMPSDTAREIVINETMIQALGLQNPEDAIGKTIRLGGNEPIPVVGVVQDFIVNSAHSKVPPLGISSQQANYGVAGIKISGQNVQETLAHIEQAWKRVYPNGMYQYTFLDEHLAQYYESEARLFQLIQLFTGLAIFIACLGLYGLTLLMAVQRTKEIGIRKVLGASLSNLVGIQAKDFLILVIIATIIAAPVAWYFGNQWLQNFAYRISVQWWIFIVAGALAVVIAFATISIQAVRTARQNPVKALKTE